VTGDDGPARNASRRRVAVEVDRLVLNLPVTAATGRVIAETLEGELARLIALQGIPGIMDLAGATPSVATRPMAVRPGQSGRSIARDVAQVVHAALGGSGSGGPMEPAPGRPRRG
jgi:hypothetical protein